MKKVKTQHNPHTVEFLTDVRAQSKTKKAKVGLKVLSIKAESSVYVALPGLISKFVDKGSKTLNLLIVNASRNDIIDNGRWIVFLGYLLGDKSLNINLWIIPRKGETGEQTDGRTLVDYIIDNDYCGKINTQLIAGDFATVVNDIGLDNLDLVVNDNPTIEDHNDISSIEMLHRLVSKGIPYIISDITPMVLYFKLHMFNLWGLDASFPIKNNEYSLEVRKSLSAPLQYLGNALIINKVISTCRTIKKSDVDFISKLAGSLLSCLNIGEPLRKLPKYDDLRDKTGTIHLLEQFTLDWDSSILSCGHSGRAVSVKFDNIPHPPIISEEETIGNNAKASLTIWVMYLYQLYLKEVHKRKLAELC